MSNLIYRGYSIDQGQNFFKKPIWIVTKDGSTPLFTCSSEDEAMAWIDAAKRKERK